jgi:two-component sensor histidine kinase
MPMARQISEDLLEVREAHHRMMNILATLLAILRRKFSQFSDHSVRSAVAQLETQILAASELLLTISAKPLADDAAVDLYLERLSRALSRSILSPANIGCEIFSDHGRLPVHVCERLGFILVELVFNASKYAFGDRNDGVVRIEMTRRGRHWRCIVSDNGIGMNGAGRGTGLNIVDALVRSLNGRLIIRSGSSGTRVDVVLPAHLMPRENEAARDAIALAEYRRRPANWLRQTSCKLTEPYQPTSLISPFPKASSLAKTAANPFDK